MNKIYNINGNHVDRNQRYNTKASKFDPANFFSTKNLILAGAKKCFLRGSKVEVVKQVQPNGIEVHFSWSKDARSWVITQRQTTILAETRSHFDAKSPASNVATLWFDILDSL